MKKVLYSILVLFVILIAVILIKTFLFTSPASQYETSTITDLVFNEEQICNRLAGAIQFRTISFQDITHFVETPFLEFHNYLEHVFPQIHSSLQKELVNKYSLLFTWKGRDESLKPILLMDHQDVVPVPTETQDQWDQPPFAGKIADGFIWGRGTLDVKCGVMGILEAVESLLNEGFQPQRTVYLAFGHDEEISGEHGAVRIVELLRSRDVRLGFVLDEGGFIVNGVIPGVSNPVALIGIAEKGYVTLELKVETEGGHSSIPPKHTGVGILSQAITDLENNPFPANMKFSSQFFKSVGPEMPFFQKMIFANMWLTRPLVRQTLSGMPEMNASIRTTTAATMFKGSDKENVLPKLAPTVINFRIMPGETVDSVIEYVRKTIDNPQIKITPLGIPANPSPVADIHSKSYEILKKTIYQTSTDDKLITAPFLVVATTDSRHYVNIAENVYRYIPLVLHQEDLSRIHGVNERIAIDNYLQMVKFYHGLIKNLEGI